MQLVHQLLSASEADIRSGKTKFNPATTFYQHLKIVMIEPSSAIHLR
jgi:hypothetical protein